MKCQRSGSFSRKCPQNAYRPALPTLAHRALSPATTQSDGPPRCMLSILARRSSLPPHDGDSSPQHDGGRIPARDRSPRRPRPAGGHASSGPTWIEQAGHRHLSRRTPGPDLSPERQTPRETRVWASRCQGADDEFNSPITALFPTRKKSQSSIEKAALTRAAHSLEKAALRKILYSIP